MGLWLRRRDWQWRSDPPDQQGSGWQPLPPRPQPLKPSQSQQLWLQTREPLPGGWYLFGIRHRGDNRRATGWLQVGQAPFRQGRPMHPVRRRWRVVRAGRSGLLSLELQRVIQPLQLQELWLLRLWGWDAWRRIRRRLRSANATPRPDRKPELWRQYNRLLNAQAHRHALVSYTSWQQLVEQPMLAALPRCSAEEEAQIAVHHWGSTPHAELCSRWVMVVNAGSQLSAWATEVLLEACRQAPQALLFYGDEDWINTQGERHNPQFKPAWNRELCWSSSDYSNHWLVAADLWNRWISEATPLQLSSWQGMVLGLLNQLESEPAQVCHIPLVLSHRVAAAAPPQPLPASALQQLLSREQHTGHPSPAVSQTSANQGYRLHWALPTSTLLSVVIPTRDRVELLEACLRSIESHPAGCKLEIVVADNDSVEPQTLAWLSQFAANSSPRQRHHVVGVPGPFNYSRINNTAVEHCRGSVLLLLNNDVELLSDGWGADLAANALLTDVGCVGAQLLYPDGTVQHGGVILGIGGIAGHAHQDLPADAAGYRGRLQLSQELSAVTAACLAISRENWAQLGGLDERHLAVNYNDVDLCLRAKQLGLRNLYLPQVKAIHHESKSRGRPEGAAFRQWRREWAVMERRWGPWLKADPAYSPHLSLEAADWSLALQQNVPLVR
jgi:GT2 family glycosyltransferase